jgi:hypothetical protein
MSAPSPRGHHDDRHFSPSPPPCHREVIYKHRLPHANAVELHEVDTGDEGQPLGGWSLGGHPYW